MEQRFPTILAACRAHGIDPVTEPIPVAPAAHYASGGVRTDLRGRTTVPGLYACGEVACTGVHGANRLASNSLLEGLVFAGASPQTSPRSARPCTEPAEASRAAGDPVPLLAPEARTAIQRTMTRGAGVLRSADSWPPRPRSWRPSTGRPPPTRRRTGPRRSSPGSTPGRSPTCSWSPGSWSPPPGTARRPAAATGARTGPTATTPTAATTWSSASRPTAPRSSTARRPPHSRPYARRIEQTAGSTRSAAPMEQHRQHP